MIFGRDFQDYAEIADQWAIMSLREEILEEDLSNLLEIF